MIPDDEPDWGHVWDDEGHQCMCCGAWLVDLEEDELDLCPDSEYAKKYPELKEAE